jgi:hypothetical protein
LKINMSEVPGYTGPAHPLSCPIDPMTAVNTAESISGPWGSGTAKVPFILPVPYLVAAISSKSSWPPGSGLFQVVGRPLRSCTLR